MIWFICYCVGYVISFIVVCHWFLTHSEKKEITVGDLFISGLISFTSWLFLAIALMSYLFSKIDFNKVVYKKKIIE